MIKFIAAIFVSVIVTNAQVQLDEKQINKIADAIYRAEGGDRAKVPYGILSIKISSKEEARRVCKNTIRNNFQRWLVARRTGNKDSYLVFLAKKYCPPSADPVGHKNWIKNVGAGAKEVFLAIR